MADVAAELAAPEGYSLRRTMVGSRLGAYDPTLRVDDERFSIALRTPEGTASIAVVQANGTLAIEGWGDGAAWMVPHLSDLLGLDDEPGAFKPVGGKVAKLWRRFPGTHLPKFPRVFDRVVRVTLLQVVTWEDACRSWRRLVSALGEDAPGPLGLRLPPSPEKLKSTPDYALVGVGIRPKQARTLRVVARYAGRVEQAAAAGPEELGALLGALPGIGPWTIAYVQGSALGFPDAVLLGDYNLPHTVAYVLAGEARATEARMLELLEPYRGHRFRVIRLLWMNGVSAPRRGPRNE